MKKLLLLSTLIAIMPFTANATSRIGPAEDISENPAMADDPAPYQTAELLPGATTNVVSASYVKGAYNDTIAAINTVADRAQAAIYNREIGSNMGDVAYGAMDFPGIISFYESGETGNELEAEFVSANGVAAGIKSQRVTAVDTWGSTHTVDLGLKTVTQ